VQGQPTYCGNALKAKLALAEEALGFSDRNIQLTIEIFLTQGAKDVAPLLAQRIENSSKISNLIDNIREQVDSENEKELLDAAGAQWSWTHSYAKLPQPLPLITGRKRVKAETAMFNVMLPLLLDNYSWRVFIEFLRAQTDLAATEVEVKQEMASWMHELLSTNQKLKSKAVELDRVEELLSQLASIIEFSNDAIILHSLDGTIVSWNKGAESIYGYVAGEVVGRSRSVLVAADQPDELAGISERLNSGDGIQLCETVHLRKDGQRIDVSTMMSPVKDASGAIVGAAAITRDITDRKALEARLRQAQKMESVGRLSGGVAHDFNNLLGVIIGYCGVLEERINGNDESSKSIQEIKKAGQRAASLTRQLLAFSRQQLLEPKILNLNTVVADISKMLRRLIGEDIDLSTVLEPELGRVKADQGQIEQVIMNLAVNARDAMPQGGKLLIETANVDLDQAYALRHPPTVPGRYVLLAVTDTGVGMDKETQGHIFEPFFTTKEKDKGTGLGLAVVYGVVKQSGGNIWVYSHPGKGTTFKIYLPLAEEVVEYQEKRPVSRPESLKGSETILLVEDEEPLRSLTRNLLVQSGYTVLETGDAAQALEIVNRHGGSIHLLLTDVVLPGMSGIVLAEEMHRMYPGMKVLFMSGYTYYAGSSQKELDTDAFLLRKPFAPDELRLKVREVLGTPFCSALNLS
jgi:two-component system, cell cycle sensor histidine kinase and response regulator CckA